MSLAGLTILALGTGGYSAARHSSVTTGLGIVAVFCVLIGFIMLLLWSLCERVRVDASKIEGTSFVGRRIRIGWDGVGEISEFVSGSSGVARRFIRLRPARGASLLMSSDLEGYEELEACVRSRAPKARIRGPGVADRLLYGGRKVQRAPL